MLEGNHNMGGNTLLGGGLRAFQIYVVGNAVFVRPKLDKNSTYFSFNYSLIL